MGERLFEAEGKEVVIVGDQYFERPGVVDKDRHGMVLSFGCALRGGAGAEKLRRPRRNHSFEPSGYSLTETLKLG